MANPSDSQIDAALARGKIARGTEPRAIAARYEENPARITIELTNGCTFSFPPSLAQGLQTATDAELSQVELLGAGYALHWEALDTDLSIPGLLAGLFGTHAHMARHAGQTTTPAKAAAARANGAKGGRPRQSARG